MIWRLLLLVGLKKARDGFQEAVFSLPSQSHSSTDLSDDGQGDCDFQPSDANVPVFDVSGAFIWGFHGDFHGGTPSHHPFSSDFSWFFPHKNHPAIGRGSPMTNWNHRSYHRSSVPWPEAGTTEARRRRWQSPRQDGGCASLWSTGEDWIRVDFPGRFKNRNPRHSARLFFGWTVAVLDCSWVWEDSSFSLHMNLYESRQENLDQCGSPGDGFY